MHVETKQEAVSKARVFVERALRGHAGDGEWQAWPGHPSDTGELQTLLTFGMCAYLRVSEDTAGFGGSVKAFDFSDREFLNVAWGQCNDQSATVSPTGDDVNLL
jgi:hypothetical protein